MGRTALDDVTFDQLLDELAADAGHVPAPDLVTTEPRTRPRAGLVAKVAGLGLVAKVALGTAVAAASVGGAGTAGLLPEEVEDALEVVAPFEFPDGVPDEVQDAIDEARRLAEEGGGSDDVPAEVQDAIDEARRLAEEGAGAGESPDVPAGFDPSGDPGGFTPPSGEQPDPGDFTDEDIPSPEDYSQTEQEYRDQYEQYGEQYRQQYENYQPPTGAEE